MLSPQDVGCPATVAVIAAPWTGKQGRQREPTDGGGARVIGAQGELDQLEAHQDHIPTSHASSKSSEPACGLSSGSSLLMTRD